MASGSQIFASSQLFGNTETIGESSRALLLEEAQLCEDRSGIVVLELGSYNLRFGFAEAEERRPASLVNCVAYRRDSNAQPNPSTGSSTTKASNGLDKPSLGPAKSETSNKMDIEAPSATTAETPQWHLELAQLEFDYNIEVAELERASRSGSVRFVNSENCVESVPEDANAPTQWANISDSPSSIIGDAALYLDDDDKYDIYFPIVNGRFNYECAHMTSKSSSNRFDITPTFVIDTLERIWRHVAFEKLGIAENLISTFDVLLVIPDSFVQREVHAMIDILLQRIGFGHILLQKSSACAALGAGKNGVCVVNVGFQHTTVCCVDDMEVLPGTAITAHIGGLDISKCLKALLCKSDAASLFFKYTSANIDNSIQDLIIFEEMKESCCHLNPSSVQPKTYEFLVRHRSLPNATLYRHSVGMAQFFAPMVICFPNLDENRKLKLAEIEKENSKLESDDSSASLRSYDPLDPFGQSFSRHLQPNKPRSQILAEKNDSSKTTSSKMDTDALESEQTTSESPKKAVSIKTEETQEGQEPQEDQDEPSDPNSLPSVIIASISSASNNTRVTSRMYSQILLIGGTAHIDNLTTLVETEIQSNVSEELSSTVHVTLPQHGVDPTNCVWIGASLLVSNTPRDFWLDRVAWRTHGLLALREKLMFSWDNPENLKSK